VGRGGTGLTSAVKGSGLRRRSLLEEGSCGFQQMALKPGSARVNRVVLSIDVPRILTCLSCHRRDAIRLPKGDVSPRSLLPACPFILTTAADRSLYRTRRRRGGETPTLTAQLIMSAFHAFHAYPLAFQGPRATQRRQ
jgi:hypothetical protein